MCFPPAVVIFSAIRKNDFSNDVQFTHALPDTRMENLGVLGGHHEICFRVYCFSSPPHLAAPYSSYFSTRRIPWSETVSSGRLSIASMDLCLCILRGMFFRPPIPASFMPIFTGTRLVMCFFACDLECKLTTDMTARLLPRLVKRHFQVEGSARTTSTRFTLRQDRALDHPCWICITSIQSAAETLKRWEPGLRRS